MFLVIINIDCPDIKFSYKIIEQNIRVIVNKKRKIKNIREINIRMNIINNDNGDNSLSKIERIIMIR